jgi:hypothetical protein
MKMAEGLFPKADGQVYYAKDANMAYYQAALAGSMWNKAVNVASGASATQIVAGNNSRKSILIMNVGPSSASIGSSNVTSSGTTTGYPLSVGGRLYLNNKGEIYGNTLTGSTDIRYLECE